MTYLSNDDLKNHIDSLCNKYAISAILTRYPRHCGANYGSNKIHILPIRSYLSYAIALHEIGHNRTFERAGYWFPNTSIGQRRRDAEALAWQWAREEALLWTLPMQWTYKFSTLCYIKQANIWAMNGLMVPR